MRKPRLRRRFRRIENIEINLTSMLDILVILVFYLIKTYSSSVTSIVVPEDISVPTSLSTNITNDALTIQISKDKKIWVEDKLVLQISNENGLKLDPLFDELIRLEHRYQMIDKQMDEKNKKSFDKPINLIMDKNLDYNTIKKIMFTASLLGHTQFKFIVMGVN